MTSSRSGSTWLLLTPAVALIAVFIFVPMVLTLWLSFHDWSTQTGFGTARFVGLRNFEDLFGPISVGRDFKRAFLNTAVYTGLSVAIILPLSVMLGLLVHQTRVAGGHALRDRAVLDLHGADDRGGAGLVEALFADRRAYSTRCSAGSASARSPGCRHPTPRSSRSSSSMSGSRSATSRCSSSPVSRRYPARSTRRRRSTAPTASRNSSA